MSEPDTYYYLVRLRHTMDDVPVCILSDKNLAIGAAQMARWQPTAEDQRALELPDMSTPVRIDVIEFKNGRPNKVVYVREYTDAERELEEQLA